MPTQYQPKLFLRRAPNVLLRRYLMDRGVGTDLPWKHLAETNIEPIYSAIERAEEAVKAEAVRDFRAILDMADEGGVNALIEEGRDLHHNVDLAPMADASESHLEMAFGVFLNYPRVFSVASRFHHADGLPGGSWQKCGNVPPTAVPMAEWPREDLTEAKQRLTNAISRYYSETQGRGKACQVDHYRRGDRLYWFAYPEDYAEGRLIYDEEGQLQFATQRPAFEVVSVYCEGGHWLDLFARGGRKVVAELRKVFGRAVLGVELEEDDTGVVYTLDRLLDRDFPFHLEPEDGIEEVRVKRLRLKVMGRGNGSITLEAGAADAPSAVHDLIDDIAAGGRIPRELLSVRSAGLLFAFRSGEDGNPRKINVGVSSPNSCSLKHDQDQCHEVARNCLKRWGIDVSDRSDDGATGRGGNAQYVIPH